MKLRAIWRQPLRLALAASVIPAMWAQPENFGVSPSSGQGSTQTFTFTGRHPQGAGNIVWMSGMIGWLPFMQNNCIFNFSFSYSSIYLATFEGTG
jgi:hypothetical protein